MKRILLLILALVFWHVPGHGGALPAVPPTFGSFGVAQGLPSSWVYVVTQDQAGYLWFGTRDGLARHDGVETVVYRHDPADPSSIGGNDVATALVDRQGRVWAGGEGSGLSRLDPSATGFIRYRHHADQPASLPADDVFALAEAADGTVWAGLYGAGLAAFDGNGGFSTMRNDPQRADSLRSDNVFSLRGDRDGRIWVGTDLGVDVVGSDRRVSRVTLDLPGSDGSSMVYAFWPEADGSMLVGTRHGLARVSGDLASSEVLFNETVSSLHRDRSGNLWIGTRNGVVMLRDGVVARYQPKEGLAGFVPGRRVFSILQDHEGGMWFATIDGGVGRLRPHWDNFSTVRHVPGDPSSLTHAATTALAASGDAIWVTSGDDGLDRIDKHSGVVTRHADTLGKIKGRLTAIAAVGDALWVGYLGGIRVLPGNRSAAIDLPVDAELQGNLPVGPPTVMRQAPDGIVWAALLGGGVARIDPVSHDIQRYDVEKGQLASADIRALEIDAGGTVWLATAAGVERLRPGNPTFERVPSLQQTSIDALALASDGSLWIHHADGLEHYRVDGDRPLRELAIDVHQGLPAMSISAMSLSADGAVWMTSTRGLWQLRPDHRDVVLFGEADGLPGIEFVIGAMTPPVDGRFWAATLTGVVSFDNTALRSDLPAPAVRAVHASVRRDGAAIVLDAAHPLTLRHDDRELSIEVRALSYANPGNHRYRFRMAGLDGDWIPTAQVGSRVFTRLDAGDYQLEAAASIGGDRWSTLPTALQVHVEQSPWLTGWAYAGYAALALLLIGSTVFAWRRRIQRRHELQLAMQRQQAAEQVAQAKSNFLATMSHEIRTPLTGVLGMAELLRHARLTERQHGQVEAIHKSGELLLRLVNDIVDLSRIEAGRFTFEPRPFSPQKLLDDCIELVQPLALQRGLELRFDVTPGSSKVRVGDPLRIQQIVLNLLNNALKFTERGSVLLSLDQSPTGALLIGVKDSGPGMAPDLMARLFQRFEQADIHAGRAGASGLGLSISRELVELMGGHIDVDSTLGIGSTFMVELPLPQSATAVAEPLAESTSPRSSLSILLVEDDAIVAAVIAGLLDSLGHRSTHAADGLAALSLAATGDFAIVLLDLDLPGIHGLQLAGLLRERPAPAAPRVIIAVTASISHDEQQIFAAGLDGFAPKPVSAESLRQAIDAACLRVAERRLSTRALA